MNPTKEQFVVEEIVVRAADENTAERVNKLKALLKATQALPQVRALSDDDIRREVEAHRSGQ